MTLDAVVSAIGFRHHDAAENAMAAARVILAAEKVSGLNLQQLTAPKPRTSHYAPPVTRDGNPEGGLSGEIAVFTGALAMSRDEAATIAAQEGIIVAAGVTRKTTILVVGDQDLTVLAGHSKSSKHRKAEDLIAKGQPIRILCETEFLQLVQRR